jgi:hypothetical protein
MSCSADYYFGFWSGSASANYYFVWNVHIGPPPSHHLVLCYTRYYYALCGWHTLPYVSSELITHKKCAKIFFCKQW